MRKARERELATLDEKSTISGCRTTHAVKKNEGNNRGGGKDDTCDHGLYVQKLESRSVPKKKSLPVEEMINQQSAARSTSSTKQHKLNCQLRTNTTACTWRQTIAATESGTTATTKPAILQRFFSEKKNTKHGRCDAGRMHATHWFLPWILSTFTTTFAWRSLTTGGTTIFPLIFCVKNVWYTLAPCHTICRRHKTYCV